MLFSRYLRFWIWHNFDQLFPPMFTIFACISQSSNLWLQIWHQNSQNSCGFQISTRRSHNLEKRPIRILKKTPKLMFMRCFCWYPLPWQPRHILNHVKIILEISAYLLSCRICILLQAYNQQLLEHWHLFASINTGNFPSNYKFWDSIIMIKFSHLHSQFLPLSQSLVICVFKFGIKMLRTVAAFR